jgi:malate dehydrogenase
LLLIPKKKIKFPQSDLFTEIALYDLVHVPGIATDLNHIDTKAKVSGYLPDDGGLRKALQGAEIVVVTAGIARKPGMTRDGELISRAI